MKRYIVLILKLNRPFDRLKPRNLILTLSLQGYALSTFWKKRRSVVQQHIIFLRATLGHKSAHIPVMM